MLSQRGTLTWTVRVDAHKEIQYGDTGPSAKTSAKGTE